jgi:hypothetical protein
MTTNQSLVCLILATLLSSAAARACPNPLVRQRMTAKLVAAAEEALAEGRYRRAFALTDAPEANDRALYRRALAIHLAAALRRGHANWTPDNQSLSRPILETLRRLVAETPDDLWLRARLAEALAPSAPAEARTILEELAAKDLMPDASAWGALAQLRERVGDAKAADAAARCRAIARAPIVCAPLSSPARSEVR